MGLYSTNRVSALTEATDIELVPDSNFGDIMECNVQLSEHERMMFESLLELDFVSATNEAVLTEAEAEEKNNAANETKKVKIGEKIAQLIDNAIAAIKKAFANFIAKFQQLSADRVVKKYGDAAMKDGALNGFKGIEDFAMPKKIDFSKITDSKDNSKKSLKDFVASLGDIYNCKSVEEVNNLVEQIVKEPEEKEEKEGEANDYFEAKQKTFVPTKYDIKNAVEYYKNSAATVRDAKKAVAEIVAALNSIKREAKRSRKSGDNDLDLAISKAQYDIVINAIKTTNKEAKKAFEMAKQQIAACRKLIIIAGKYALKGNKGEDKAAEANTAEEAASESALDYIIGESSDQYVYNVFAN